MSVLRKFAGQTAIYGLSNFNLHAAVGFHPMAPHTNQWYLRVDL